MKCPKCDVLLALAERQGIEIDYCPQCRGVWLDRGELDKIIERNAETLPNNKYEHDDDQPRYLHRERDDRYQGKPYKRKSLLGEIFDF